MKKLNKRLLLKTIELIEAQKGCSEAHRSGICQAFNEAADMLYNKKLYAFEFNELAKVANSRKVRSRIHGVSFNWSLSDRGDKARIAFLKKIIKDNKL
jgi:hypothetical protein